jgi:serine phosphatase RsbU (regulator of sigma subunit)
MVESTRNEADIQGLESRLARLEEEMANLQSIIENVYAFPSDCSLSSIDISGRTYPLAGPVGGDHIIFVDFKRRYDLRRRAEEARQLGRNDVADQLEANSRRVGVLVADVSGHSMTDALLAAMLHQAFLVGVLYELETNGQVTARLFEHLNTRFYKSSSVTKYLTMVYGEINEDGAFRFISAGHPRPLVFSAAYDRFVTIDPSRTVTFLPIGMFPSESDVDRGMYAAQPYYKRRYTVNEVNLMGGGDILILATDGLLEHGSGGSGLVPDVLERVIRDAKAETASTIVDRIHEAAMALAPADDDMSLVVIKKL